jgi:hypothetical protein
MRRILRKNAANEQDQLGDTSTLADPPVVAHLIAERLGCQRPGCDWVFRAPEGRTQLKGEKSCINFQPQIAPNTGARREI